MRELEQLNFLKLVLAEDAARVFARGSRFRTETGGPRGDIYGQFFLRDRFVAIQIVQFDFGSRGEPEVGAFELEKIGGELRQLPGAGERRAVHQERRKNL